MTGTAETTTRRRFALNPVLQRELVERWRGRRAFLVLTVYLGVLVGALLLLAWTGTTLAENQLRQSGLDVGPTLGRFLFENLYALVLLLVLFVGPGYAAAQIAGERERRTLGLLQITLVKPWGIVLGKLGAASAWLLLLVLTAAPMGAIAFFLGGVTVGDLVRGAAYLAATTVAIAAIGIGISSLTRKTTAAIVTTYAVVLALVIGTLFGALVEAALRPDRFNGGPPRTLQANPFVGLADATHATANNIALPSILTPFAAALPNDLAQRFTDPVPAVIDDTTGGGFLGAPVLDEEASREPVWLYALGLYVLLGAGGLATAARRVRPDRGPRRRRPTPMDGTTGEPRTVTAPPPPPVAGTQVDAPPPPPPDSGPS